jgi:hypothetical protein
MLVAFASSPSFTDHQALSGCYQVAKQLAVVLIVHDCARRHRDDQVFSRPAGLIIDRTIRSIGGDIFKCVAEGRQGIEGGDHFEDHISPMAAIAAIWPAACNELFTVEMHKSIAALSGPGIYDCFINEHKIP